MGGVSRPSQDCGSGGGGRSAALEGGGDSGGGDSLLSQTPQSPGALFHN